MKKINAIRLCAAIASSLLLGSLSLPAKTFAAPAQPMGEIQQNITSSPNPVKLRILGAAMFSFAVLTAILIISREIRLSQPNKQRILSKYYRN